VQRARPVVTPPGEARSNWELFGALARALGFEEPLFRMTADEVIDLLLAQPSPWRPEGFAARLAEGRAVELVPPPGPRWRTPSGKIELANPALPDRLPRHRPARSDAGGLPLRLVTGPAIHTLNSSFMERPELRERNGGMSLRLAPADAAARGIADGDRAVAWNDLGEVLFVVRVDERVPAGVAVAEGVWWTAHTPGGRNVNALTSQHLTDAGAGSTFYDNRIDVRRAAPTT
jgi:anaerobic selenocysteine-containing dehydrogenase